MKLLVNKVSKRILALFLTVVSVFAAFGIHTPAKRTVTAATGDTYELVADVADLADGDEVIIVAKGKNVAMGAQNGSYRSSVSVTINDGKIIGSADVQFVTLKAATGGGDNFSLLVGDEQYLYWDSSNSVKTGDTAYAWTLSIAGGDMSITSVADNTRRLRYNASSPRFACYTSPQTSIELYKKSVAPAGHTHEYTSEITTAPTCTEEGVKTYTCANADGLCNSVSYTETVAATGHKFVKGVCVNTDCDAAQSVYAMVTDVATLAVGDEIIIVAKNSDIAMSTTQNSNNRGQATIEKDVNLAIVDDTVQAITLATGAVADTFAFQVGEKYLYAAGGTKNNYLRVEAEKSENSSWSIEIDVDGNATIKTQSQEEGAKNWLRYNATSECFSCYASGQKDIAIYKLVGSAADFYAMTEEFSAMTTDASFKLGYTGGEVTSAKLRFGTTMSKALCERLMAAGATFGVEVNNGTTVKDCKKDGWVPAKTTENGVEVYMFAAVIGGLDNGGWATVLTAKVYAEIGGKKYYMAEAAYSVNTLAEKYKQTETDESVLAIIEVLSTQGGANV